MSCIYLGKKEYWDHIDNAARDVAAPVKRAGEVGGGRLKALYAYEAGKNLKQASDTFHSVKDVKKGLALTVGVGSMKSESHSLRTGTEAASSTLAAGGNVSVTADRDITSKEVPSPEKK